VVTTPVSTSLNGAAFKHVAEGLIVGDGGTLLRYRQGLVTAETDPTGGADIVDIDIRPDDKTSFVLACSDATAWLTMDDVATWTQVRYDGDDAGSLERVGFAGARGVVLWLLHTGVGGTSRLLRDICGGAGGNNNVEIIPMTANLGYSDLVVYDQNEVLLVGAVSDGQGQIVKVTGNNG
jgi:hypothetical protein